MIRESLLILSLYSFNFQDFIFLITSVIDIFAATIIAISTFQAIIPMMKVTVISTLDVRNRLPSSTSAQEKLVQRNDSRDTKQKGYWIKKNFVRGLLLALELESANAILKMGLFTSIMIETQQPSSHLQDKSWKAAMKGISDEMNRRGGLSSDLSISGGLLCQQNEFTAASP